VKAGGWLVGSVGSVGGCCVRENPPNIHDKLLPARIYIFLAHKCYFSALENRNNKRK